MVEILKVNKVFGGADDATLDILINYLLNNFCHQKRFMHKLNKNVICTYMYKLKRIYIYIYIIFAYIYLSSRVRGVSALAKRFVKTRRETKSSFVSFLLLEGKDLLFVSSERSGVWGMGTWVDNYTHGKGFSFQPNLKIIINYYLKNNI